MNQSQNRTIFFVISILSLTAFDSFGQSIPKYSNEFLSIGVGARAFGMANTVVASVDDVTAGYWNPSGLVNQEEKLQVGFMHSNYFSGLANYDYLGVSTRVKDNAALPPSKIVEPLLTICGCAEDVVCAASFPFPLWSYQVVTNPSVPLQKLSRLVVSNSLFTNPIDWVVLSDALRTTIASPL